MREKEISENLLKNTGEISIQESLMDALERSCSTEREWIKQGIVDVPVDVLPVPDGISGADDFRKISMEQMTDGLKKLQEMRYSIDAGIGKNAEYWSMRDHNSGLDYQNGYRRVYDAFYGHDAIRLEYFNAQWNIINGRHRIWLAKQLGIKSLPASVLTEK